LLHVDSTRTSTTPDVSSGNDDTSKLEYGSDFGGPPRKGRDRCTPVGDVCRQLGVSEATFYAWKKKYAHLGVSELRRLRQLEAENGRLKRLVADLTLDKHMLSEALRKNT
jgi:putative transposase